LARSAAPRLIADSKGRAPWTPRGSPSGLRATGNRHCQRGADVMQHRRSGQPWGIVIAVALCVVVCAPAAPAPAAAPPPQPAAAVGASAATQPGGPASTRDDSQVAWEQALAAARQEGSLVLALQPGDVWRQWVERFEQTYPGIKLEATSITGADFVPRVLPE